MIDVLINGIRQVSVRSPKEYSSLAPRFSGQTVDIGIDQSKSHTAIVVGPAGSGGYSDYIEILGEGADTDVYDVCALTRRVFRDIFKDAVIRAAGIEEPITKSKYRDKEGKTHYGAMDTHKNRLKLTAIFDNYLFLLYDIMGQNPMVVNNEDWKGEVLPEEYRTKAHKKGSYDWHNDNRTQLAGTNDNVTDAACILDYVRKKSKHIRAYLPITDAEVPRGKFDYIVRDYTETGTGKIYQFNQGFSFDDNLAFVANRTDKMSVILVPVSCMPIEEFYKDTCKLTKPDANSVFVFVGGIQK